jgi:hypothetical protein
VEDVREQGLGVAAADVGGCFRERGTQGHAVVRILCSGETAGPAYTGGHWAIRSDV